MSISVLKKGTFIFQTLDIHFTRSKNDKEHAVHAHILEGPPNEPVLLS